MKKLDNFSNCLRVLESVNFDFANEDEVYRTGVIGQFNLTLELACKALQEVIYTHIYNEDEIDEMLLLIRDSFTPAFVALEKSLKKKADEVDAEWT